MKSFLLFLSTLFLTIGYSFGQTDLNLDSTATFEDTQLRVVISNIIPDGYVQNPTVDVHLRGNTYQMIAPPVSIHYAVPYLMVQGTDTFRLFFSPLPLINLEAYHHIDSLSDDLVAGKMQMTDSAGFSYNSFIGIKIRGGSSRSFPKKSYQVRLWTDSASAVTKDTSFWNMRSDDKWLLLAMWNEKLRLNNVFCEGLWRDMAPLYYAAQEPDAQAGIRMKYV